MFDFLDKNGKEELQMKGYMIEHLFCLYSMVVEKTALYNNCFPVFFSDFGEVDVTLFGFKREVDMRKCVQEISKLPINLLNIISPTLFSTLPEALLGRASTNSTFL